MFRKIVIVIRLILPFLINIILLLIVYNILKGDSFTLINSLFYVGVISILYGLVSLIIVRREQHSFLRDRRTLPVISAIFERDIEDYQQEEKGFLKKIDVSSSHISLIYIILGITLLLSSIIYYY